MCFFLWESILLLFIPFFFCFVHLVLSVLHLLLFTINHRGSSAAVGVFITRVNCILRLLLPSQRPSFRLCLARSRFITSRHVQKASCFVGCFAFWNVSHNVPVWRFASFFLRTSSVHVILLPVVLSYKAPGYESTSQSIPVRRIEFLRCVYTNVSVRM